MFATVSSSRGFRYPAQTNRFEPVIKGAHVSTANKNNETQNSGGRKDEIKEYTKNGNKKKQNLKREEIERGDESLS